MQDLTPFLDLTPFFLFIVESPDSEKYTDITINYTIAGEHAMDEGFVMKFGEIGEDGSITQRSYGEGDNWKQTDTYKSLWDKPLTDAWNTNHNEINDSLRQND